MKLKLILFVIGLLSAINLQAQRAGKTYNIESAIGNKYLDVQWAQTANGTPTHLWPFNGKNAQKFTLEDAGDGYFYIKSALGNNKYLHIKDRSNKPKAIVHLWTGKGNDNTKWRFKPAKNGYFFIQSKKGTYLDVQKGRDKAGTPIWMYQFNGKNAQKWRLFPAVNLPNNVKIISPENFGKHCITTKEGHSKNGRRHIDSRVNTTVNTKMQLINNNIRATVTLKFNNFVSATWSKIIYRGGSRKIKGFNIQYSSTPNKFETYSERTASFTMPESGSEFGFGCNDGEIHTNNIIVGKAKIIGDTGGVDISDDYNCKCDSKLVDIIFNKIAIKYDTPRASNCSPNSSQDGKPKYEFTINDNSEFSHTFTEKDKSDPNNVELVLLPNKRYNYTFRVYDKNGVNLVRVLNGLGKELELTIHSNYRSRWKINRNVFGNPLEYSTTNVDRNNPKCDVTVKGTLIYRDNIKNKAIGGTFQVYASDIKIPNQRTRNKASVTFNPFNRKEKVNYFN